jgi:hypothetical protein
VTGSRAQPHIERHRGKRLSNFRMDEIAHIGDHGHLGILPEHERLGLHGREGTGRAVVSDSIVTWVSIGV